METSLAGEDARWWKKARRESKLALRSGDRKKKQTWADILALIRSGDESRSESHPVTGRGLRLYPNESPFHMFYEGEYVCEYWGEHISMQERKERHAPLKARGDSACYIFEAEHRNWCRTSEW